MAGYFEGLLNRGAMPALEATWSFAQQRHRTIAENIANLSTPGYKAKHLDYAAFQKALGEAVAKRASDPTARLVIEGREAHTDAAGRLVTKASTKPGRNAVFHDQTNMSLEQEMADLAENGMLHEMTTQLLSGRFESLRKAIRGRA